MNYQGASIFVDFMGPRSHLYLQGVIHIYIFHHLNNLYTYGIMYI